MKRATSSSIANSTPGPRVGSITRVSANLKSAAFAMGPWSRTALLNDGAMLTAHSNLRLMWPYAKQNARQADQNCDQRRPSEKAPVTIQPTRAIFSSGLNCSATNCEVPPFASASAGGRRAMADAGRDAPVSPTMWMGNCTVQQKATRSQR
jgi:hypothetical protein